MECRLLDGNGFGFAPVSPCEFHLLPVVPCILQVHPHLKQCYHHHLAWARQLFVGLLLIWFGRMFDPRVQLQGMMLADNSLHSCSSLLCSFRILRFFYSGLVLFQGTSKNCIMMLLVLLLSLFQSCTSLV